MGVHAQSLHGFDHARILQQRPVDDFRRCRAVYIARKVVLNRAQIVSQRLSAFGQIMQHRRRRSGSVLLHFRHLQMPSPERQGCSFVSRRT